MPSSSGHQDQRTKRKAGPKTDVQQRAYAQHEHIELIASENYASPAVMEAQGSA